MLMILILIIILLLIAPPALKIRSMIRIMSMSKKKPELLSQPGLFKTLPRKCR